MRVLVTRPEPGAARTASRLAALGHEPVMMPLFKTEIAVKPGDLPPAARIRGLIATSARAVALFGGAATLPEGYSRLPVACVGPATAAAARDAGFVAVSEGAGTAGELAERLADGSGAESDGSGAAHSSRPWLYLAGAPRTPVIEDALKGMGQPFLVIEAYRMHEISYSTDIEILRYLSPPPELVLLYSVNAARRFSALILAKDLGKAVDSAQFVCLSPSIAAALPLPWRARALAVARPEEDSLLASLAGLG